MANNFNLTHNETLNQLLDKDSSSHKEYTKLHFEEIKDFKSQKLDDGTTKVTYKHKGGKYACIYETVEKKDLLNMLKTQEYIKLQGCYINDFPFEEIKDIDEIKTISIDARYSCWKCDAVMVFKQFHSLRRFDLKYSNVIAESISFKEMELNNCKFDFSRVNFKVDEIYFEEVVFNSGSLYFYKSIANTVFFKNVILNCFCDLRFKKIDNLLMERITNHSVVKCNYYNDNINNSANSDNDKKEKYYMSYKKLSFYNFTNLGAIYLDYKKNDVLKAITNSCEYEGHQANEHPHIKFDHPEIAAQLAMLKENYHTIGNYEYEDKAYRDYMNYKTNKWYKYPIKIFNIIGGYGTQPFTIILAMLMFWLTFGLIYYFGLLGQFNNDIGAVKSFADTLYYSGITFLTIGYGDIAPAISGTTLRFFSIIEGFIGLFLMSYLTVAVVRKLLR